MSPRHRAAARCWPAARPCSPFLRFSVSSAVCADENSPEFKLDFETAAAEAADSGKPMIVIASAVWCPPCQHMKKEVYPDSKVEPYHDDFVWAYLDADEESNQPVLSALGVTGLPHIAFLTPGKELIGHFNGATSPKEFTRVLDQVLDFHEKYQADE